MKSPWIPVLLLKKTSTFLCCALLQDKHCTSSVCSLWEIVQLCWAHFHKQESKTASAEATKKSYSTLYRGLFCPCNVWEHFAAFTGHCSAGVHFTLKTKITFCLKRDKLRMLWTYYPNLGFISYKTWAWWDFHFVTINMFKCKIVHLVIWFKKKHPTENCFCLFKHILPTCKDENFVLLLFMLNSYLGFLKCCSRWKRNREDAEDKDFFSWAISFKSSTLGQREE